MFKKVLVPVCGETRGSRTRKSLDMALELCDGEIILLHVTEPIATVVGGAARQELEAQMRAEGTAILAPMIEKLQIDKRAFHTRVEPGTVAETIISIADQEDVDLIVMYTDGRDELSDMLLGSITERVLRNTTRTLLVVHN